MLFRSADLRCEDQNVHAATPGQYTKKYHVDAILYYDQLKVPGTREVGLDPSVANLPGNMILQGSLCNLVQGGSNLNPATGDRWCLQAKVGRYTMMSDLFFCKVGEDIRFLRGYWESASIYKGFNRNNPMQTFRMENEHVMTMSMGRADTNKPDSDGNLIFVPGHTFPMEKKRFLFFTLATEQEILEIDKIIANQAGTYVRCPDGHFDVKRDGACSK